MIQRQVARENTLSSERKSDEHADDAYAIADAMLKERDK
jgi:hypothetical protein